ncbi:DMT family transporter [Novosphingobium sp. B 225]|uniref:DMT family transporter n=1 Tax=Novosphingobium sp. B 225 TaxID=1961849 RepID=UPI000B4B3BE3|nr:DMT family transporter [Novosphingobium sp. B 225]
MRRTETTGLFYAMAGFAVLSCGDAVVKTMTGEWAPTAIAMTRYIIGALGLGVLLWRHEGPAAFRMPAPRVQLLRGGAVAMATIGFFSAVFVMPLATATAITFTSPMLTALLAALLLGEPARRETLVASVVAFAGVLVVLRPNFAVVGWAALLPLLSALGMSVLMIGNRFVAGKGSVLAMQFYVAALASVMLILATTALHFSGIERFAVHLPHWSVIARCALVACSASCAHWLIYMGTTKAGAATVAPMTYIQLLVATLFGWLMFENHPDAMTLAGAAIIIGAGLYLWHAGRVRDVAGTD